MYVSTLFVALLGLAMGAMGQRGGYCVPLIDGGIVPLCEDPQPRDLLFLVDASNSMNRAEFYSNMLDFLLALYCAFDPDEANQAGMIIFAQQIYTRIPLDLYTQNQWFVKVNEVRNDSTACCSCCTPTAEAFDRAEQEFLTNGKNNIRLAFVITDGTPSNNNPNADTSGLYGNPDWWYYNANKGYNPSLYATTDVANEANELKALGNTIILVGVPNYAGRPPDVRFFTGGLPQNSLYSVTRGGKNWVSRYRLPPNPIVDPDNAFSSNSWDVSTLINLVIDSVCRIPPTPSPTFRPTDSPTKQPTRPPVPTKTPTLDPTKAPTRQPTKAPTKTPTKLPTRAPTSKSPTQEPTASPVKPYISQVDLTFLIDRSRSLTFPGRVGFCAEYVKTLPLVAGWDSDPSSSPCWELWMRYILRQAEEIVKSPAGPNENRQLGWYDDFVQNEDPAKGLRVRVVAFACRNNQRSPKVFPYSDDMVGVITNMNMLVGFLDQIRKNIIPDGGTCPGLSIEYAIRKVEEQSFDLFPLQSIILATDGRFYDMPYPERATTGLDAYRVMKFAVGIAVANSENDYGLTKREQQIQINQLTGFVEPFPNLFKNLGEDGWALLDQVAVEISQDLAALVNTYPGPERRYTWCGWRRRRNCAKTNYRMGNCKWPRKNVKQWGCMRSSKGQIP